MSSIVFNRELRTSTNAAPGFAAIDATSSVTGPRGELKCSSVPTVPSTGASKSPPSSR